MQAEQAPSGFDRFRQWTRTSVTLKLISIGFIILILLIPLNFVEELVRERSYRNEDVQNEISQSWGPSQGIYGLAMSVPFSRVVREFDGQQKATSVNYVRSVMTYYPETFKVDGNIKPETLKRGIFQSVVYDSELNISGAFLPPPVDLGLNEEIIVHWEEAYVTFMLGSLSRVSNNPEMTWAGQKLDMEPTNQNEGHAGLQIKVPLTTETSGLQEFNFTIGFKGSRSLYFAPLAKENSVKLSSTWPSPKFDGSFLPAERNVTNSGFSSEWKVLHLNRPLAQRFEGGPASQTFGDYEFGVDLLLPVDHYTQTDRAAKYAVLLIALTFALFFMIQIIKKVQIHPMQFLLVGLALSIFYTLLLAISEHLSFSKAYVIAAASVIGLITAYFHAAIRRTSLTIITFVVLSALYLYIFTILQLEDYALLMGSIGLFLALALVMMSSRNFDWYNLRSNKE
jgi:inner membrane protein